MRHAPILIALAVATAARAEGEPTLHLAVHGSLDSTVLGPAIAKELGVAVVVVEGRCDVPCLDVSVDGRNVATVLYAPRLGSSRLRKIAIGSDTTQWPLVITLLAGNVVRDEVRDVLANLPPPDLRRPADPDDDPGDVPPAPDETPADTGPAVAPPGGPGDGPDDGPDSDSDGAPVGVPPGSGPDSRSAPSGSGPEGGPDGAPATAPAGSSPDGAPVAPAPDDSAPVALPEPAGEHSWLGLGFVPVLSTDLTHVGSVRHFLSFNLLVGVAGGSSGLSVSGIADIQRGLVAGFQVGGVVAIGRRVAGTQVAGIAAVSGDLDGVQIAGTAAVADRVDGFQIGGIAAVARSRGDHQIAGVAAVARGRAGIQAAGIAAVASGDASAQAGGVAAVARGNAGIQLAGIAAAARDANLQVGGVASVARGTANIQVAGLVNVARRLRGIQLAPINVAREVDGIQVGVINVGGSRDGFSFGLINIVPGGRYDLEAAVDSNQTGTVLFRHGGRRWHNVYGVGGHPVNQDGPNDDVWMYGLGFGPSLSFDRTVIDLEAIGWQVNHGPRHETDVSILGQLRLSVAHHWGPFAIVAGGILNAYITNDHMSPLFLERRAPGAPSDSSVTVTTWPSAFIGLRI